VASTSGVIRLGERTILEDQLVQLWIAPKERQQLFRFGTVHIRWVLNCEIDDRGEGWKRSVPVDGEIDDFERVEFGKGQGEEAAYAVECLIAGHGTHRGDIESKILDVASVSVTEGYPKVFEELFQPGSVSLEIEGTQTPECIQVGEDGLQDSEIGGAFS